MSSSAAGSSSSAGSSSPSAHSPDRHPPCSSSVTSRLHPLTFWCHECDMSVSLLPSPSSPLLCPDCRRLDSLLPLDSPFPHSIPPLSLAPFFPSHPSPDLSPSNPTADSDSPRPLPAPDDAIAAIPTVEIDDVAAICAICKDGLPHGSSVRRLPCSHLFHSDCIVPWLSLCNSCPLCRSSIPFLRRPRRLRTPRLRLSVRDQADPVDIDMEASLRQILGSPWVAASPAVSPTQMGLEEMGSTGPANSGETVTSEWHINGSWGGLEEAEVADAMLYDVWEDVFA
ncbi:E3 ubiquitin-protein ligase RING1-like [Platanthera zijinensis]|uniref:RING-type E3 ubiquitin transferase n=1 Tax=Platanthera zijinensis TaxID=2320716 RepID=A0AAP0BYH2_9ASPA